LRKLLILSAVLFFAGAGFIYSPGAEAGGGGGGISEMNVVSRNLRHAGGNAYLLGILGGRSEYLINHPFVLGGWGRDGGVFEIAWYYGIAYPATSNAWSGATVEFLPGAGADRIKAVATKPVARIADTPLPRSVREWMAKPDKNIKTEQAVRELVIDNAGMLQMSEQAYKDMRAKVVADIETGLKWCLENRDAARNSGELRAHLERVAQENAFSSTVKLDPGIERLLSRVMGEVFGK